MNNIIELRREYLNILTEELTPLVYEGIHQIYNECAKISNDTTVLRNFQTALKKICDWNNDIKTKEMNRILTEVRKNIIMAIFKAEIMIMGNKYDDIPNQNIEYIDFVHTIYKECGKNFWSLPFLFYNKYTSIEINRNNYEIRKIIKDCIEHSFRKLIPVNDVLKDFLGDNMGKNINLSDLLPQQVELQQVVPQQIEQKYVQSIDNQSVVKSPIKEQTGGSNDEKILQIINENIKLSESPLKSPEIKQHSSRQNTSSTLKKIINESINNKYTQESTHKNSVNSEIKNHLMKDLESETLTYNPETNIKNYHDVFSNSDMEHNTVHNSIKDTTKQKFINNYLTK